MPRLLRSGLALGVAALATLPAAAKPPSAEQILSRAETIRNPDLEYAVDFRIHGTSHADPPVERDASYSMLASGKDRSVILMRSPDNLFGSLVLMTDGRYWMLLPRASRAWELSSVQMQNGDVATGDIARANFLHGYDVVVTGEEKQDGEPCYKLELTGKDGTRYARVAYWVAKRGYLPWRLEQFSVSGKLLKVVRYLDFRKGPLGLRSMSLTIESLGEWKETSALSFANLRKIVPPATSFVPEGLIALRDAAMAARTESGSEDVPLEKILQAVPGTHGRSIR